MNQPLLDVIAFAVGAIAVMVDRRRAVAAACVAVALGLSPAAAIYGGGWAAVVVLGAGALGGVAGPLAGLLAGRRAPRPGLDPLQAVGASREGLFGPRSVRVAAAMVALVAASWISFNVPVGSVAVVKGALFPVAFVFTCGVLRTLLGRNLTDIAVGLAVVSLAAGVAWLLRGGGGPLPDAVGVIAIAPAVSAIEGWLGVRHRRPATVPGS
ncbi:MAG: hypothetical protein ACLQT7_08470 [Candidatus Dormibacteria bacterium]